MATVGEAPRRSPFPDNPAGYSDRSLPILPSTASHSLGPGDPMDTSDSQGPTLMPPPSMQGSASSNERAADNTQAASSDSQAVNGNNAPPVGAAAAAQQPKVVQTAFIHKLYKYVQASSSITATANLKAACWRTRVSNILYHGRARTRASSCRPLPSSPKSWRESPPRSPDLP